MTFEDCVNELNDFMKSLKERSKINYAIFDLENGSCNLYYNNFNVDLGIFENKTITKPYFVVFDLYDRYDYAHILNKFHNQVVYYKKQVVCMAMGEDTYKKHHLPNAINFQGLYKSNIILDGYLDNYIYGTLGAANEESPTDINYNLNNTPRDNLGYLHSYFPKSFAEMYCIFDNLLSYPIINEQYKKLETFRILCVGVGTGGDVAGTLKAVFENLPNIKTVEIVNIDGNKDALDNSSKIIYKMRDHYHKEGKVDIIEQTLETDFKLEVVNNYSFDIVLTNKFLNEIIKTNNKFQNHALVYYNFINAVKNYLKDNSLLVVSDVADCIIQGEDDKWFFPEMLAQGAFEAVKADPNLKILLPLTCDNHDTCKVGDYNRCYTKNTFTVKHSSVDNSVECKIGYRVLCKQALYQKINPNTSKKYYACVGYSVRCICNRLN